MLTSGPAASPTKEAARVARALRAAAPRGMLQLQLLSLDPPPDAAGAQARGADAGDAPPWWSVEMHGVTVESCRAVRAAGGAGWEWEQWLWWSLPKPATAAGGDAEGGGGGGGGGSGGDTLRLRLLHAPLRSPTHTPDARGRDEAEELGWATLDLGAAPEHASTRLALELSPPVESFTRLTSPGTLQLRLYVHVFGEVALHGGGGGEGEGDGGEAGGGGEGGGGGEAGGGGDGGGGEGAGGGLPYDPYGFQVRAANVGPFQAHLRSVEQDAPMWLAQWNALMRGVGADDELPPEVRSLAGSVLSRGVPPQHRPQARRCAPPTPHRPACPRLPSAALGQPALGGSRVGAAPLGTGVAQPLGGARAEARERAQLLGAGAARGGSGAARDPAAGGGPRRARSLDTDPDPASGRVRPALTSPDLRRPPPTSADLRRPPPTSCGRWSTICRAPSRSTPTLRAR